MSTALIGYSGFVGQTILRSQPFDDLYRSTNINNIKGKCYDLVVGAGAPAKKWLANKDPDGDAAAIDNLIENLSSIKTKCFVLISTVDVFQFPINVDENTKICTENLHPYGLNRWRLEEFVKSYFKKHLIIRLPGLVGRGLKKNIIFDFLNNNQVNLIESRNVFQFYPMKNLWKDIELALNNHLSLVHLTAAPVNVEEVAQVALGRSFENHLNKELIKYDMRSVYAEKFWNHKNYQYSKEESLAAIGEYFKTEKRIL